MKMKQVSIAVALVAAGISGQAFALNPTDSAAAPVHAFISGSSAQQKSLGAIATSMCQTGTIDVYYDSATGGKNHRAYSCTVTGTGTALDTKNMLINNRAQGGSGFGVIPVARAQAIDSMVINTASCGSAAVGTTAEGYPLWNCANTTPVVPDAGVSDVEPALFVGINKASATDPDFDSTDKAKITSSSQLAVVFGTPVSNDLYNAGLTNMSRAQIASILSGTYKDWSKVKNDAGVAVASGPITICRRAPGSGTQAANNAWFNAFPCSASYVPPVDATATDPVTGYTVIENASAGAVLSCMNTHTGAIGVLGTETQPGGSDNWHFVSIDGIAPTVQNAATGKYDFFVEQTMQWRKVTVNGILKPAGDQLTLLTQFKTRSGNATTLGTIPGVAGLWTNGQTVTIPFNATKPVMQGSRFTNTCKPTTLNF